MEVRLPISDAEHQAANALAEREYQARGHVDELDPVDDSTGTLFVAVHNDVVVGTVTVALASLLRPLPTAHHFGFQTFALFPGYKPEQILEIMRLAVASEIREVHTSALQALIAAMQFWGDAHGVKLAIASLKPTLRRALSFMGISSADMPGSERYHPVREAIPGKYHGYFFPAKARETPMAVYMVLDAVRPNVMAMPEVVSANTVFTIGVEPGDLLNTLPAPTRLTAA